MIKTAIFDLAEVCMRGIKGIENVLSFETGINPNDIKKSIVSHSRLIPLFEGKMSEREYFSQIQNELNLPITFERFQQIARDYLSEAEYFETHKIIREIKKQDIPVYLFSDHAEEWINYIETKEFMKLFDKTFYSFNIRKTKLSEESFLYVLKNAGLNREDTIFIDDSQVNIETAEKAGIKHTILFTDAKSLRHTLKESYNLIN